MPWIAATGIAFSLFASTGWLGWHVTRMAEGMFPEEPGSIVDVQALLFAASVTWAWTVAWIAALVHLRSLARGASDRSALAILDRIPRLGGLLVAGWLAFSATQSGLSGVLVPVIAVATLPASVLLNPIAAAVFYGSTLVAVAVSLRGRRLRRR